MNQEEQRIAIAEACKFYGKPNFGLRGLTMQSFDRSGYHAPVPDYLNDLNAMHEAEKVLTREQLVDYCAFKLRFICGEGCAADYKMIRATAAQRAEAFLKTIGKWKV